MKKFLIGVGIFLICIESGYALQLNFKIDSSRLSLSTGNRKNSILNNFNKDYKLSYSILSENSEVEEEIKELTKKTTYLLLGDFNNTNESSEDYYRRHQDYLKMGAYQTFPRDKNSKSGYDESVSGYNFAVISEFTVPSMFLEFDKLGIQYNNYGDIRIIENDNLVISMVFLSKVKMKEASIEDPKKYDIVETDLTITYYFLKIGQEYKLSYLYGETSKQIDEYFTQLESNENKASMQVVPIYNSNLREIYDYSKLDAITDSEINEIYHSNKKNIVTVNSYYNNYLVASANGFFINEGFVVTTWNFIEKSLMDAQYIAMKDSEGISYEIEGIVTANPETDIAIIKLKNKVDRKVNLNNSENLKVEDPVITLSSKTGVGITTQKGIVIASDGYIQSTIPLSKTDEGSPLFDANGNVVGMNTAKQTNTNLSMAIRTEVLKEVQNKFDNIDFDAIETISFDTLKEQFYYTKYNEEIIENNISKSRWKKYSEIGNLEENIKLKLLKASDKNGIVSLRYQNEISNYISSMQLASPFKEQLIEEGYKEVLNGKKKCIYKNNKYQIIIMDEFDYLIIVMVKL